jgi:hypothetical protein
MIEDNEPNGAADARRFEARMASDDRSPLLATVLVVVFVGLTIVKPWATDGAQSEGSTGPEPADPAVESGGFAAQPPSITPAPSPTGEAVLGICHGPGSWRTATIETWRDQTVRVWRAIDPRPASRPLDPSIPVVPAVGTAIPAIGYCAPTSGPNQPLGAASIRAWRVDGDAVQAIELRQIAPVTDVSPYGALFGPPAELGSTTSWPNGLVVFRYEELATGVSRWFAIEVSGTSEDRSAFPPSTEAPTP